MSTSHNSMTPLPPHSKEKGFTPEDDQGEGMSEIAEDLIAEAITEQFGERCPGFDSDCYCCKVWKQYDDLKAMQWQPIETAPRDEQKILATAYGYEWPEVIFYQIYDEDTANEVGEPGFWRYADDLFADVADIEDGEFTHWMPLPKPPSTLTDESKLRRSKALDELGALDGELL